MMRNRRHWGAGRVCCLKCWDLYESVDSVQQDIRVYFEQAAKCPNCVGTQRDAMPWSELFRVGRLL